MKKAIYLLLLLVTEATFSQAGTLDTTFNPGATVFGATAYYVNTALLQSDGKILAGGYFNSYNGVSRNKILRLNSDGSLDTSFTVGTGFSLDQYASVKALAIQPDGKIIAAGSFSVYNGTEAHDVVRLNTDGTLDTSFSFPARLGNGSFYSIIIQNDGKIVLGGGFTYYYLNGASTYTACNRILRLNPDGSIDSSFQTGNGFNGGINKMIAQPDGKLLVGGDFELYNDEWTPTLVRLNENGTRDTTFQVGNGFAGTTVYSGSVTDIDLLNNGSIFITGNFTTFDSIACDKLVKLLPNGNKDWGFDITSSINIGNYSTYEVTTVESNGKIVVCTNGTNNGNYIWNVIRFNSDGSFDTTFNSGNGFNDTPRFSILQPDGKLIFFGPFTSYNGSNIKFIARIIVDPPQLNIVNQTQKKLIVYPNPVSSEFNIQTSNNLTINKIKIYDMLGKEVLIQIENMNQVNISNLGQGIYFIKVITEDGIFQTNFIKK